VGPAIRRWSWSAVGLMLVAAAPAAGHRSVPRGWVGVTAGLELLAEPSLIESETGIMARAGVEAVRVPFIWAHAQPYARWTDVPPDARRRFVDAGGRPFHFATWDRLVAAAARHRLPLMPTVLGAPAWASDDDESYGSTVLTPRTPADYAGFLRVLATRYGPRGSFWRARKGLPKAPVGAWQVWNEPDLEEYWRGTRGRPWSWAKSYVRLLAASYRALKRSDPHARVVIGGLTNYAWSDLRRIYRAGGRRWFDVAAVHPYTREPRSVVSMVELFRRTMTRYGDAEKPIILTEAGWPAALHRAQPAWCRFCVDDAGMASRSRELLTRLAQARRRLGIFGVYWYTWLSRYSGRTDPFAYAGLRSLAAGRPRSTPAFSAFKRTARRLEGRR
jgi:hypothetical protein